MRRYVLLLTLSICVLFNVAAAAAGKHKAPLRCSLPVGANMLSANSQAQVYSRPERAGPHGRVLWPEIFGCTFNFRSTFSLGEISPKGGGGSGGIKGIAFEVLSGPFVAYEYSVGSENFKGYHLLVMDLRTGRILRSIPSGPSITPTEVGVGPIVSVVVKGSDGAVAWVVESEGRLPLGGGTLSAPGFTLFAFDKNGERQLAVGKDVDPSSLAIAGNTLYWTQGGVPSSTHLN